MKTIVSPKFLFDSLDSKGILLSIPLAILLLYSGISYFFVLLAFFLIAAFFTKYGSSVKGIHKPRGWRNVLANGAVPMAAAIFSNPILFLGAVSAITADKLSGEIGQLSKKRPVLITSGKQVKAGTNGGITLLGELASVLSGLAIGLIFSLFFPQISLFRALSLGALSGFLGANFDSLLGALFENRGFLNKHQVNFLASLFGAGMAFIANALA